MGPVHDRIMITVSRHSIRQAQHCWEGGREGIAVMIIAFTLFLRSILYLSPLQPRLAGGGAGRSEPLLRRSCLLASFCTELCDKKSIFMDPRSHRGKQISS